jgi:DNA-directed RNA polymerase subunit RPC12/RpoP
LKFECADCRKQFEYAAKLEKSKWIEETDESKAVETHVCPYCESLNIFEVKEKPSPKITALIDVPLAEVNAKITEGYVVLPDKIYSKNAILVKFAEEA